MSRVHSGEILVAVILIVVGLLFLASNLGTLPPLTWHLLWPLVLILFGAWLIWRALFPPPRRRGAVYWSMGDYRPDLSGKEIRQEQFSHGLGDFDLDLTRAVTPDGENFVKASHGIGDLTVIVPRDLSVRVQAKAGMGDVRVFGQKSEGLSPQMNFQSDDYATATRKLSIEASVGLGEVSVVRAG